MKNKFTDERKIVIKGAKQLVLLSNSACEDLQNDQKVIEQNSNDSNALECAPNELKSDNRNFIMTKNSMSRESFTRV